MVEHTAATGNASKAKKTVASMAAQAFEAPKFELPKFEIPKFDMPGMEIPAAFREFAEKGVAQARENYEKCKSAAEQATEVLEDTYTTAAKGYTDYGLKLIDCARTNTNATFDLAGQLVSVKSFAELVEVSSGYMRAQFETLTAQAKELSEHAQKVATATAEPIKESVTSLGKAA